MKTLRVLVVDPQSVARSLVAAALRPVVSETFEAVSAAEAFQVLEQISPDLVILDLSLGYSAVAGFAEHIAQLNQPPLLLLTGEDSFSLVKAYDQISGCHHYLGKPYLPGTLQFLVQGLLEKKSIPEVKLSFSEQTKRIMTLRNQEAALEGSEAVEYSNLAAEYQRLNLPKEAQRLWLSAAAIESNRPLDVASSLSGVLEEHRLGSILHYLFLHKLTGLLTVEENSGSADCIYFQKGKIVDALGKESHGYECLRHCLGLMHGHFHFYEIPVEMEDRIEQATDKLLLDLALELDISRYENEEPFLKLPLVKIHG